MPSSVAVVFIQVDDLHHFWDPQIPQLCTRLREWVTVCPKPICPSHSHLHRRLMFQTIGLILGSSTFWASGSPGPRQVASPEACCYCISDGVGLGASHGGDHCHPIGGTCWEPGTSATTEALPWLGENHPAKICLERPVSVDFRGYPMFKTGRESHNWFLSESHNWSVVNPRFLGLSHRWNRSRKLM